MQKTLSKPPAEGIFVYCSEMWQNMMEDKQLHIRTIKDAATIYSNRSMCFKFTILFGCEQGCVWPYHSTQDDAIHLHFHHNGRA
jgi:hypothetical protein